MGLRGRLFILVVYNLSKILGHVLLTILLKLTRRFSRYILVPLLGIVSLWVIYFLLFGNFHKVDKDIYRSAQLFSFNMPYYVEKYQIKSVLNLRGASTKEWYTDEMSISREHNITHYDYGIGDRRIASSEEMNHIVDLIKSAPKPLLIHCKAGADRTSLATALYLYEIKKESHASDAISLLYGHFPWLGSKTVAMDKSFKKFIEENN